MIIMIVSCTLLYVLFIRARCQKIEAEQDLLFEKWITAQERRRLWEDEHLKNLNFDDFDYQELWDREIGAEALYLISIYGQGVEKSWPDYCQKQKISNWGKK